MSHEDPIVLDAESFEIGAEHWLEDRDFLKLYYGLS
jgi:hypothetical protein